MSSPRKIEEDHAETLPTGAVIVFTIIAAILLIICLLFAFRGCGTEPEPTMAPAILTTTKPAQRPMSRAAAIIQVKAPLTHKRRETSHTCIPDGVTCGAILTVREIE